MFRPPHIKAKFKPRIIQKKNTYLNWYEQLKKHSLLDKYHHAVFLFIRLITKQYSYR